MYKLINLITKTLKSIEPFKNNYFEIKNIYFNDPYKKCFLINLPFIKKKFKIRVPITQYPNTAQYEYKVLKFLENYNIEWSPRVYYYGEGIGELGNILIYEYLDGKSLDRFQQLSINDANIIVEQLEKLISDLHSIKSQFFGEIEEKKYISWCDYMLDKFSKHLTGALENKLFSNNEFEKIQKKFLLNTKYYNQVKSSLLHYDIKPANIIYNKISKKVTLIDFELTRFGDINSEFTRAFVLSEKFSNIHNKIIIPMLKNIYGNCYNDFINSDLFHIYSLYHMMALYNFLTTDNLYDVTIYAKKIKSLISDLLTSAIFL